MCRGMSDEDLKTYKLRREPESYNYIKCTETWEQDKMSNKEWYDEVYQSMKNMDFSDEELYGIFAMTAVSLLLGEIEIDDSEFDPDEPIEKGKLCKIKNRDVG